LRLTHHSIGLAVLDDVLPPRDFAALSKEVGNWDYHSVHDRHWDKSWRLWDGQPLRGTPVYYDPTNAHRWDGPRYPTSTAVDHFVDALREVARAHPALAGAEGAAWNALFLSPWLYPVGSALSLHLDGGTYSGAFTFFAHTRWSLQWGGELLVLSKHPSGMPGALDRGGSAWISEDEGWQGGVELGIATCVFPQPNRLVVVGPDLPHMIRRVDANAGAHVRASLAGFFLRS
jgi:hypothetical protein